MTKDEKQILLNLSIIFGIKIGTLLLIRKLAKGWAGDAYLHDNIQTFRGFTVIEDKVAAHLLFESLK